MYGSGDSVDSVGWDLPFPLEHFVQIFDWVGSIVAGLSIRLKQLGCWPIRIVVHSSSSHVGV